LKPPGLSFSLPRLSLQELSPKRDQLYITKYIPELCLFEELLDLHARRE